MKKNSTLHHFLVIYGDMPDGWSEIGMCDFLASFTRAIFICFCIVAIGSVVFSWIPILFFQVIEQRFEMNISWFIFVVECVLLIAFTIDNWKIPEFIENFCTNLPSIKIKD